MIVNMKLKLKPRCFFDIDIGHSPAGRIIFELFDELCPKTVDNFIKLCTGECGNSETTGKKLHYLSSTFHRVIKGFMIQGGDFTNGDGSGGESIYGGRFNDENLDTPHDKPFLLSMANCGPNTNGSQFFITTKAASHLDGKHVVFGHVVSGENLIESIENLPVNSVNKPIVEATISNCGKLIAVRKKKSKKQKEKEVSVDSSSDKGKKKKKSKKKKHRNKRKMKIPKEDEEEQAVYPKCSVRPDEIPEVPKPFFLYRGNLREENTEKIENKETVDSSSKYVSKDLIGRSGRIIKGRGQLRYNSKSPRDRMDTPPHWKKDSYKSQTENTTDRYNMKMKSISSSPNRDYQSNRQNRRENGSPRPNHRTNDNNNNNNNNNNKNQNYQENEQIYREKKRKNDVWKDLTEKNEEKSKRLKKDELEDYGDVDKFEKINQKNISHQKRSSSLEKIRKIDREKNNNKANNKSKNVNQNIRQERVEGPESGTIIYPYGDESDESLKHKRSERIIDSRVLGQSKSRILSDKDEDIKKKSGNYDNLEKLKPDDHAITRKRSTSESYRDKSISPNDAKSPPAHLLAKWQNRREKIMIRRSPISRSNERNQSRSRYSPRRRSPRYSKSPRSDKNKHESKPQEEHRVPNNNIRKISKDRSSSGTMDSSLSSAGSSVINDSTSNQQVENNKEKKTDMPSTSVDKIKENELKTTENLTEKETVMVIKPPEKPWLTNQWKTEDDEANKKAISKSSNNSILAKLREDDQKKSQEKPEKPSVNNENRQDLKKIPSPVSQSISKYRSPSGTKSSNNDRSSYSSSSSSRSDSRRRSRSRSGSRSYYKRKYRSSHNYRSSRRSTSRSLRRYRSRSRSFSRSSRRRYSSRSTSTSRSSRYIRSSRRNYRGLGFRRPSVSPRPRK